MSECLPPYGRYHLLTCSQGLLQKRLSLTQMGPCVPEPPQGIAELQGQRCFLAFEQPLQCCPQVVMFVLQPVAPRLLRGTEPGVGCHWCPGQEIDRVRLGVELRVAAAM